jgi:hypothetical protein
LLDKPADVVVDTEAEAELTFNYLLKVMMVKVLELAV